MWLSDNAATESYISTLSSPNNPCMGSDNPMDDGIIVARFVTGLHRISCFRLPHIHAKLWFGSTVQFVGFPDLCGPLAFGRESANATARDSVLPFHGNVGADCLEELTRS